TGGDARGGREAGGFRPHDVSTDRRDQPRRRRHSRVRRRRKKNSGVRVMKWNYSNAEECETLFASSAEGPRWLCFTLTANEELADRAFESALQQSLKGASRVFQQWMASWARRQIIKSCIAVMR